MYASLMIPFSPGFALDVFLLHLVGSRIDISSPSSVEFPDDHVDTLESNDHVHVERDAEVKTQ